MSRRHSSLLQQEVELNDWQRQLINELQGGFPLCDQPFAELAKRFNRSAEEIQATIQQLLDLGVLSRFGPLFNIEGLGGCFSLCALQVPEERFDEVAEQVNSYEEVAHNYAREHQWNMWFVLATKNRERLHQCFDEIVAKTRCPGMNLPKLKEFFVGLHFDA